MIDTKQRLFDVIDQVVEGLRAKSIVKDAIDDYTESIRSKINDSLNDHYQYVIWHDGGEWIISIRNKEQTNCFTLNEWINESMK